MRASLNELTSLLKQAFEGCGLDHGAYESAAELVLWSQAHGFAGFECLEGALTQCLQAPKTRLTINQDQAEYYEMDMLGDSLLLCGPLLNDLAIVKALESGICVSKISNVSDRVLLAKLMADAQQQALYGIAYWIKDDQTHLIGSSEQDYPDYFQYVTAQSDKESQSHKENQSHTFSENQSAASEAQGLTLVYARDQHRTEQYQRKLWFEHEICDPYHSSSQSKQHYQSALDQGLEIPDSLWVKLTQIAGNVLVESTGQSRLGAGA